MLAGKTQPGFRGQLLVFVANFAADDEYLRSAGVGGHLVILCGRNAFQKNFFLPERVQWQRRSALPECIVLRIDDDVGEVSGVELP